MCRLRTSSCGSFPRGVWTMAGHLWSLAAALTTADAAPNFAFDAPVRRFLLLLVWPTAVGAASAPRRHHESGSRRGSFLNGERDGHVPRRFSSTSRYVGKATRGRRVHMGRVGFIVTRSCVGDAVKRGTVTSLLLLLTGMERVPFETEDPVHTGIAPHSLTPVQQ